MKKYLNFIKYSKWKPIVYYWPYPEGYGIYRKNRFTGQLTVLDRYKTKQEAVNACLIQNNLK